MKKILYLLFAIMTVLIFFYFGYSLGLASLSNKTTNLIDNFANNILGEQTEVRNEEVLVGTSKIVLEDGDSSNTYNAKVAVNALNGKTIGVGEEFSFNQYVGERTKEKGYIVGHDIDNNPALGGGVCRAATLVYQAAVLDGKLECVERHPHSKPVDYARSGTDATVSYGSVDLRFLNTSGGLLKLYTSAKTEGTSVILELKIVKLQKAD